MYKALIFSIEHPHPYRSLGAHRISTFLRKHGWDIEVLDFANWFELHELQNFFRSRYSDDLKFVGVSCNFSWYTEEFDIFVKWVKETYPHVKLLIGGQYLPQLISKHADYFVIGFGENAMLALLQYLFSNGEPVRFRIERGKKVVDGNAFYPSFPMKSLMVEYETRDYLDPNEWLGVEFGRGCKFECPYCNFPILGTKSDHTRDADDYAQQLQKTYDDFGIHKYLVADETFNETTEKIVKFADATEKLSFMPYLSGFIRADLLVIRKPDREHLARMGFLGQYYGVESLNYETSKVIGKGIKTERLKDGLLEIDQYYRSNNLSYRATVALVVGLPKETMETQQATFEWIEKYWLPTQSINVWALEIPSKESTLLKPSKMSYDLPKYGYKIAGENNSGTVFHTNYSEVVAWENEHFTHQSAKTVAQEYWQKVKPITLLGSFGFSLYMEHPDEILAKGILNYEPDGDDNLVARMQNFTRYKNLKLNLN